jgi:hypothetical protein
MQTFTTPNRAIKQKNSLLDHVFSLSLALVEETYLPQLVENLRTFWLRRCTGKIRDNSFLLAAEAQKLGGTLQLTAPFTKPTKMTRAMAKKKLA